MLLPSWDPGEGASPSLAKVALPAPPTPVILPASHPLHPQGPRWLCAHESDPPGPTAPHPGPLQCPLWPPSSLHHLGKGNRECPGHISLSFGDSCEWLREVLE